MLNQETGPDIGSVYMTVACDLVIQGIAEPVRSGVQGNIIRCFVRNTHVSIVKSNKYTVSV